MTVPNELGVNMKTAAWLAGTALALTFSSAQAESITIGLASEASAIDPHYHNLGPNNQIRRHMFESLIWQDATQNLTPLLAESWEATDDTTWTFKLREGVKFHDGSDFDAQDVVWTVCRIPNVVDSPSSFTTYTKGIADIEIVDPFTIVFKTDGPYPLLATEVSTWGIIAAPDDAADMAFNVDGCEYAGEWPATEDFNNGNLTIGTGAYKFGSFTKGDRLELVRNDDYWGGAEPWESVTFRPITSDGPRVAALLAGDVDLIEKPPVQDLPNLIANEDINTSQGLSNRVIYIHFDHEQEPTPGVEGTDGKNPFKDVRVRQAVSKAINREAIVDRIMSGVAQPAAQLLPESMFGSNPDLLPEGYDPDGAKALLEEAGYGDGFKLVIGAPNDRYINDEKVTQAVAQMLTRIGIETSVDAVTASVFFSRRNNYEFSMYLAGWGSGTGEMSSPLKALLATRDPDKGMGNTNRGRYANADLDAKILEALATVDDTARAAILAEASAMAMADYAILPLHYEVTPWAFRSGLSYEPRADQYTLALSVKPAQ